MLNSGAIATRLLQDGLKERLDRNVCTSYISLRAEIHVGFHTLKR